LKMTLLFDMMLGSPLNSEEIKKDNSGQISADP